MSPSTWVGRRFAGFCVERELGAGGMGLVVLARQESLDRPAVLKRIHPQLVVDEELEARFEREAIAAGRLHHSNVVGVYDRFKYRGDAYLATEYVDGVDLAGVLAATSRLPWRIAAAIALEITRGLEAIHASGTLHRDVKPQNILIGRQGEVKITDFGLAIDPGGAALTLPGIAVGTPPYMPPEQLRAEPLDPRADLFALGCVLYEMLVGTTPYQAPAEGESESMLSRVESGRYPAIRSRAGRVPRKLRRFVARCLRPRAARRMASARELREGLEGLLGRPSGADCREWIAAFAWERQLFKARETETVVRIASPAHARGSAIPRAMLAVALVLVSLVSVDLAFRAPERMLGITDSVMAALAANTSAPRIASVDPSLSLEVDQNDLVRAQSVSDELAKTERSGRAESEE